MVPLRLHLCRLLIFLLCFYFMLVDNSKVFDETALQTLLIPAIIVPVEIQVSSAFRATPVSIQSSHIYFTFLSTGQRSSLTIHFLL